VKLEVYDSLFCYDRIEAEFQCSKSKKHSEEEHRYHFGEISDIANISTTRHQSQNYSTNLNATTDDYMVEHILLVSLL
jgi:hypothetical protein